MEEVTRESLRLRWDPRSRILSLTFQDDADLTVENADRLIRAVRERVGDPPAPYGMLVDATAARGAQTGWRSRWSAFHRTHPEAVRIAAFGAKLLPRLALGVYARASGARVRIFATEAEARAWLESELRP